MPTAVYGSGIDSLREAIKSGNVKERDVLVLSYNDGASLEVLYASEILRGANDAPVEVRRKHTVVTIAEIDFVGWERKGSFEDLYGKK